MAWYQNLHFVITVGRQHKKSNEEHRNRGKNKALIPKSIILCGRPLEKSHTASFESRPPVMTAK